MEKRRRDSKAIQRADRRDSGAVIQTPSGPTMIQVIDIPPVPANLGQDGGGKPKGINILSAVLRRWWLVLLVTAVVGTAGILIANRLIRPSYEAESLVLYHASTPPNANAAAAMADPAALIRTYMELLTKPEISLLAARNPELQQAFPWLKSVDLESPPVQKEVARFLRNVCEATRVVDTELVRIHADKSDGFVAAAVANAFADAFVDYCSTRLLGHDALRHRKIQEQMDQQDALLKELTQKKSELTLNSDLEARTARKAAIIATINEYQKLKSEAEIKRIAADAELSRYVKNMNNHAALSAELQLARKRRIEEEKAKDSLLQAAVAEQVAAYNAYMAELGAGKTEQHRDVILAKMRVKRSEASVSEREQQIASIIDAKVAQEQKLMVASSMEQAQTKVKEAESEVASYEQRLGAIDQEARQLAVGVQKLEQLNDAIARTKKQYDDLWQQIQNLDSGTQAQPDVQILVAERAEPPAEPTDDKRIKVQAASLVGGLFLGILMALLVDRFDKRLRNPRDIERLLGAPMLGMIPRMQQLKRAKGDQSRSLVAEEFRLIRTQLLFDPEISQHKTICVTSPSAGDGKTSLAVNLAIALAKTGRRVLLVDGDLRKPDIHRIFNVPEVPGLAELLLRSAEPATAIRKTDIEHLDILPAGLPMARPCELLSRPETPALIETLDGMYDQIIIDSAPLLPVSDTQVLLAMVDGVICAFGADVDTSTIEATEGILRRAEARLIGSIMNQVGYRQSTTYHREKLSYSSYYSQPRQTKSAEGGIASDGGQKG
ncbi:MAG: polysaccharide biosynthesis tyrosine autokinase [Bacillota bacterium]